ncbi:hypothetical protein IF1G_05173 [Cordyceps javanica]|uniref:Uncharacterized protein n=1 Tax=Cordyceps javanica TaxID=43265 RepID=A0A545V4F4_9HYPO|nr:hypothetical protein IF1G_05173 [Cordyceps javanica]
MQKIRSLELRILYAVRGTDYFAENNSTKRQDLYRRCYIRSSTERRARKQSSGWHRYPPADLSGYNIRNTSSACWGIGSLRHYPRSLRTLMIESRNLSEL